MSNGLMLSRFAGLFVLMLDVVDHIDLIRYHGVKETEQDLTEARQISIGN